MKLITWNINFWQNYGKRKGWKENIAKYLSMLDYDFILLQESNPLIIFDKNEYQFEINGKNVYFNKLLDNEIGTKTENITSWGNSIIADKEYSFINNNFLNKYGEIENYYFGKSAFMCYDFKFSNKNITLMNFYNKKQDSSYPMLKFIIADIEKILDSKKDNIIILSGDFNSDKVRDPSNLEFFNQLNQIGLINCTESSEFETTMVPEIGIKKQYPNDKIFVNEPYNKYVICKLIYNTTIELSDHRPIECNFQYYVDNSARSQKQFLEFWNE